MRKRKLPGAQGYTGFKKVQIVTNSYLENCYERQLFKFLALLSFYIFGNELSCRLVVVNSVSVRVGSLGDLEILARF